MTDLISRADAIDAVKLLQNTPNGYSDTYDKDCIIGLLEELPSADAVHGEWVIRENGNKECSVCGHERQDGWDYFCGYCGARMKAR